MPLSINLPKEVENFVIKTAQKEQISESELIQRALQSFLHEQRIQNYKNDIKLIRQGKMKVYSTEEVFGEVRKMIDELK